MKNFTRVNTTDIFLGIFQVKFVQANFTTTASNGTTVCQGEDGPKLENEEQAAAVGAKDSVVKDGTVGATAATDGPTDSCTSDVSDMKICEAPPVTLPLQEQTSCSDDGGFTRGGQDFSAADPLGESALHQQACETLGQEPSAGPSREPPTIDLTAEAAPADNSVVVTDVIDLTEESSVPSTATVSVCPVIDLTVDTVTATPSGDDDSAPKSVDSVKSRRSKRAPIAVYVPPKGRGPPGAGGTAPKKSASATGIPSTVVTAEEPPGLDVTEQVSYTLFTVIIAPVSGIICVRFMRVWIHLQFSAVPDPGSSMHL